LKDTFPTKPERLVVPPLELYVTEAGVAEFASIEPRGRCLVFQQVEMECRDKSRVRLANLKLNVDDISRELLEISRATGQVFSLPCKPGKWGADVEVGSAFYRVQAILGAIPRPEASLEQECAGTEKRARNVMDKLREGLVFLRELVDATAEGDEEQAKMYRRFKLLGRTYLEKWGREA